MQAKLKDYVVRARHSGPGALLLALPVAAFGQAASPFMTGATALQTNILGFTPRIEQLAETCNGVVRWAGGDARRDP
jgi:hypothetical protein